MRLPTTAVSVGARIDRHPAPSPVRSSDASVVAEGADRMERLLTAVIDEIGGPEAVGDDRAGPVDGVAFGQAYRDLSTGGRRLVRYLGLHPEPDFDAHAAAALCNLTLVQARRGLGELRERHLVIRCGGRYRFPDRFAEHVRRLSLMEPAVDRDAALARLGDAARRAAGGRRAEV